MFYRSVKSLLSLSFLLFILVISLQSYASKISDSKSESIEVNTKIIDKLWNSPEKNIFLNDFPNNGSLTICTNSKIIDKNSHLFVKENEKLADKLNDFSNLKLFECQIKGSSTGKSFFRINSKFNSDDNLEISGGIILDDDLYIAAKDNPESTIFDKTKVHSDHDGCETHSELDQKLFDSDLPATDVFNKFSSHQNNILEIKNSFEQRPNEDLVILRVAIETDFELFELYKNKISNDNPDLAESPFFLGLVSLFEMRNDMIDLMGLNNIIFAHHINTSFRLGQIYFYTINNDPWNPQFVERENSFGQIYETWDTPSALSEVSNFWQNQRPNISRSAVWFLSGNDGGGRAFIGKKIASQTGEVLPNRRNNPEWYEARDYINAEDVDNQNLFGLDQVWRYEGTLCTQNGVLVMGMNHEYEGANLFIDRLDILAHENGHLLGSPHTRCYNPVLDQYGREDDGGGCTDRINFNLPRNFESTLMSYAPNIKLEFAPPVVEEMEANLFRIYDSFQNGGLQNCSLEIIEQGAVSPTIINGLEHHPEEIRPNENVVFNILFSHPQEEALSVYWNIHGEEIETSCFSNQPCEIEYNFNRSGLKKINIVIADNFGNNVQREHDIFIEPNEENNSPPQFFGIYFTHGFEVVEINGERRLVISPLEVFNLEILASDPDRDGLFAHCYFDDILDEDSPMALDMGYHLIRQIHSAGEHNIRVEVSDGIHTVERELNFIVENLPPEIENISYVQNDNGYTFNSTVIDPNSPNLNDLHFHWRFSDGRVIQGQGPEFLSVSHNFLIVNFFLNRSATLTVTDSDGLSHSSRIEIPRIFPRFGI